MDIGRNDRALPSSCYSARACGPACAIAQCEGAVALLFAGFLTLGACGGKSHVDVDILGDAAVTQPPGTQTCSACSRGGDVCLLGRCVSQCEEDRNCGSFQRCLRTDIGNGCVESAQINCSLCTAGGTVCVNNECRTRCAGGCAAADQSCRNNVCYGNDATHDPGGGGNTSSSGAGGSTGAGGSGQGGSNGNQCAPLTESCSHCMCVACPADWQACSSDLACQAIGECVKRTGCRNNDCYRPELCQREIDANGGPVSQPFSRVMSLAACASNQCQGACGPAGSGDGGVVPSAGWWRFDEGFGSTTADASGNGRTGMLVNSPSWQPGIVGQSVALNGANQYVRVASSAVIGMLPSFTIEAWVNWGGTPGHQAIYAEGGPNDAIALYLEDGLPVFATFSDSWISARASQNVPEGSWHQLAAVLQTGTGGTLYLDGVLISSNPRMVTAYQGATETDIGRFPGNGGSRYYRGLVDDVRVFYSARSSQEIREDYYSNIMR